MELGADISLALGQIHVMNDILSNMYVCTSKPQSTLRVDPYYPSPGYRRDVKKKVKLIGRGSPNVRCTSSFCVHNLLRRAPRFIALVIYR